MFLASLGAVVVGGEPIVLNFENFRIRAPYKVCFSNRGDPRPTEVVDVFKTPIVSVSLQVVQRAALPRVQTYKMVGASREL